MSFHNLRNYAYNTVQFVYIQTGAVIFKVEPS